jgi:hypothetical protein
MAENNNDLFGEDGDSSRDTDIFGEEEEEELVEDEEFDQDDEDDLDQVAGGQPISYLYL